MRKWMRKVVVFVFFVLLGLTVFVVFSHMRPMLSDNTDMIGRMCLAAGLLLGSLFARRSDRLKKYWTRSCCITQA